MEKQDEKPTFTYTFLILIYTISGISVSKLNHVISCLIVT